MINRMDYIVKYNGNKGDILLAKKTCESVVLGIANSILEETKKSEINHNTVKEQLIDLINVCADYGVIKALEKIIDGKFDEGDVFSD